MITRQIQILYAGIIQIRLTVSSGILIYNLSLIPQAPEFV